MAFGLYFYIYKATTSTSNAMRFGFGGTATLNYILYQTLHTNSTSAPPQLDSSATGVLSNTATLFTATAAGTTAIYRIVKMTGAVSVSTGGTFIPQYGLTAAPGGSYTTGAGSYFLIYPVGASGSNISVGTWA